MGAQERVQEVVKSIGLLLLEDIKTQQFNAGGLVLSENLLAERYEPALQQFVDFCAVLKDPFTPAEIPGLRQLVLDDVTRYLERKGMLA